MERVQYTLEQISPELDQTLQERARAAGKTVDRFVVDFLEQVFGAKAPVATKRDLRGIAGTWVDDPEFDKVMKKFSEIEPEMWK